MEERERLIKSGEFQDFSINNGSINTVQEVDEVRPIHRYHIYEPPEDYYWLAVTSLICCFFLPPFGIVAVYKARQVPRLYIEGEELAAYKASGAARGCALLSFMFGIMSLAALIIILASVLHLGL